MCDLGKAKRILIAKPDGVEAPSPAPEPKLPAREPVPAGA